MRRACFGLSLVVILASALEAKKRDKDATAGFPRVFLNARFVYVTSFTGGQFNTSTYPEDRAAIKTVEEALEKWGRYSLVYKPEQADLIFHVRAGRELEVEAAVRVGSASPPTAPGGNAGTAEMVSANLGPKDDYVEILMPTPTERLDLSRATILWNRTRHHGLGQGAPIIQEFRKEADAAAAHDAESKKKP
jgi:hypothetical protein